MTTARAKTTQLTVLLRVVVEVVVVVVAIGVEAVVEEVVAAAAAVAAEAEAEVVAAVAQEPQEQVSCSGGMQRRVSGSSSPTRVEMTCSATSQLFSMVMAASEMVTPLLIPCSTTSARARNKQ